MTAKIDVPGAKIRPIPFFLAMVLPKGFSITIYPYIFLAKEVYGNQSDEVIQHELYHASRQKPSRFSWFYKYVTNRGFKYDEECRAYAFGFCFMFPGQDIDCAIDWAANLLSSTSYSNCAPSPSEAAKLIRAYYGEFES